MSRKNITKGLRVSIIGAYVDFFAWSFLQQSKDRKDNSFLEACQLSLDRTFTLQVANLFEDTKGVISIKKYQKELKKGGKEEGKVIYKEIYNLLEENDDKIRRLTSRRGIDLAHTNLENFVEAMQKIPTEKRSGKAKKSLVTGKEIIELLELAKEIYRIIEKHELNTVLPITSILTRMESDYNKVLS